eukprot:353530-Chlamydomonas_euryale.AAC.7
MTGAGCRPVCPLALISAYNSAGITSTRLSPMSGWTWQNIKRTYVQLLAYVMFVYIPIACQRGALSAGGNVIGLPD